MVKHLKDMFTANTPCGAVAGLPSNCQDLVFDKLKGKFTLTIFSCVQIASKLWLHSDVSFTDKTLPPYHPYDPSTQIQFKGPLLPNNFLQSRINQINVFRLYFFGGFFLKDCWQQPGSAVSPLDGPHCLQEGSHGIWTSDPQRSRLQAECFQPTDICWNTTRGTW